MLSDSFHLPGVYGTWSWVVPRVRYCSRALPSGICALVALSSLPNVRLAARPLASRRVCTQVTLAV